MSNLDFSALLLDLDGTVVDSEPTLYDVYCAFLEGFDVPPSRSEFEKIIGPSIPEIVGILKASHALPGTVHDLAECYERKIMERYPQEVSIRPGAVEVLEDAASNGVRTYIVTSALYSVAAPILAQHGLDRLLSGVVTADGISQSKPAPDIYIRGLRAACVEAGEAVAFEDSSSGVQAALGARVRTVLIGGAPLNDDGQRDPRYLGRVDGLQAAWALATRATL